MSTKLYRGDCIKWMEKKILDRSVDLVLVDMPYRTYGTKLCTWDREIPFEPMWEQLKRVIVSDGVCVMTCIQPFTSALINSNLKMFRYCWVWNKKLGSNFASAPKMPLKITEDIAVFAGKKGRYYPIKTKGRMRKKGGGKQHVGIYGDRKKKKLSKSYWSDMYHPTNIIEITNAKRKGKVHPTQKPVALMEYLIRTYTLEGETVLDFAMGSGTTGIAAKNLGRSFIGIEIDKDYFQIAKRRIKEEGSG